MKSATDPRRVLLEPLRPLSDVYFVCVVVVVVEVAAVVQLPN